MPRLVKTDEYLAGFISGRMGVLQAALDTLASDVHLSEREMLNMRNQIDLTDASVRSQHRAIENTRLRPKLNIFEAIVNLSLTELARREQNRGHRPTESEAMRARRLRNDHDLDPYASDGRGEVPLEYWTTVEPGPGPDVLNADDLRRRLDDRRQGRSNYNWSPEQRAQRNLREEALDAVLTYRHQVEEACRRDNDTNNGNREIRGRSSERQSPPIDRHPPPRRRSKLYDSCPSPVNYPMRNLSPMSARSRSSISSYVSQPQEQFSEHRRDVELPPMLDALPYPIDPNDKGLIGLSEIYVRRGQSPEERQRCPQCHEGHRMTRCPVFDRFNLQQRWYSALSYGVCLHCLRPGHSSFTCLMKGACHRCEKRHNSLLCMRHPTQKH